MSGYRAGVLGYIGGGSRDNYLGFKRSWGWIWRWIVAKDYYEKIEKEASCNCVYQSF